MIRKLLFFAIIALFVASSKERKLVQQNDLEMADEKAMSDFELTENSQDFGGIIGARDGSDLIKPISMNDPPRLINDPPRLMNDPSRLKNDPSRLRNDPPRLMNDQSGLKNDPPRLINDPPRLMNDPPRLMNDPSRLKNDPPRLKNDPPRLRNDPPRLMDDPPRLKNDPPRLMNDPQRLMDDPSRLMNDPPKSRNDPPRLMNDPSRLKNYPPRLMDDAPRLRNDPPGLMNDPPRLMNDPLRLMNNPSRLKNDPPRLMDDAPRLKNDPPRLMNDPPRLMNDPPRLKNDPPRLMNNPPRLRNDPPRLKNDPPRLMNDPPRLMNDPPRLMNNPPRLRNDPPKLMNGPPRLKNDPPRLMNAPPRLMDDPPRLMNDPPRLMNDPPRSRNDPPRLMDDPPRLMDDAPRLRNDPPRLMNDPPRLMNDPPRLRNDPLRSSNFEDTATKSRMTRDLSDDEREESHGSYEDPIAILNQLDDVMTQEQDFRNVDKVSLKKVDEVVCVEPILSYCKDDVNYPVAKMQMSISAYYEGLVASGLDLLSIRSKGAIAPCQKELKRILCRERFPRCKDGKVHWNSIRKECGYVIEKCPQTVRDELRRTDFCGHLNTGDRNTNACVTPIPSKPSKYCKVGQSDKVSPWDRHSAIEVNSLMEMQQVLFHPKAECTKRLSEYLCYPTETCAAGKADDSTKRKIKDLCKSALKACHQNTLSQELVLRFMQCERSYQ